MMKLRKTTFKAFLATSLLAFGLAFWGCKGVETVSVSTGQTGGDSGSSGGTGGGGGSGDPKILMFVAYHDVWWAEYKVAYEAFKAAGYDVDVRSSKAGYADSSYSADANSEPTTPTNFSSGAGTFTGLFQNNFGTAWDSSWNTKANIPINGLIQDVTSLDDYKAFVFAGGIGAMAYRYDGSYPTLGPVGHQTSSAEVQAAAVKINALVNEALTKGIPVASQCHGASLLAFVRAPIANGVGPDGLGVSILNGKRATGFPGTAGDLSDTDTDNVYSTLGVTYLSNEKVVVDGPDPGDFASGGLDYGRDLIVTSRDWYPQTVAQMARTVLNMIDSYPSEAKRTASYSVLVYGEDNPPVNHGQAAGDLLYYTDLGTMLTADTEFTFNVTATSDPSTFALATLQNYDVLVYFGHEDISTAREQAIRSYVDGGGGFVGIHHAVYNGMNQFYNPTLIGMIGAALNNWGEPSYYIWAGGAATNTLINVNLGSFVSSYGTVNASSSTQYTSSNGLPNENQDGSGTRGYWSFTIPAPEELYPGTQFEAGTTFGRGINQINRVFANNYGGGQYDTHGFTKLYDYNLDGTYGKIVYLQPGERKSTIANSSYAKAIKNAVVWAAPEP